MQTACENIDRLVHVSIRPPGMPRSKMAPLYDIARGDNAISYDIARVLLDEQDAKIGIFTGATVPDHLPKGENDGPLGSIALGRALRRLGRDVTIYTEAEVVGPTEAFSAAVGADVPVEALDRQPGAQHAALATDLDIAIAVEKAGVNEKGVQHSINGNSRSGTRCVMDDIILAMNEDDKVTIGIGDGGNEIGFGAVYDDARELLPFGKQCKCGCGGGIVTTTATTHFYPVAISNWGAYALAAALAIGRDQASLALTPDEEDRLLRVAMDEDCRDGGKGAAAYAVDGVSGEASVAYVRLLEELVTQTLTPYERHF